MILGPDGENVDQEEIEREKAIRTFEDLKDEEKRELLFQYYQH